MGHHHQRATTNPHHRNHAHTPQQQWAAAMGTGSFCFPLPLCLGPCQPQCWLHRSAASFSTRTHHSGSASMLTVLTSFRTNSAPMFESTAAYRSAPSNAACASYETPVAEYTSPAVRNDSMVNVCLRVQCPQWGCVWTVHAPQSSPVHVVTWYDGMGAHHTRQRLCRHMCASLDGTCKQPE